MLNGAVAGRDEWTDGSALHAVAARTVVVASADAGLRQRLRASLTGLRWRVLEAGGGAEAIAQIEDSRPETLLVDSWLPDLEVSEFAGQLRVMYPAVELMRMDGAVEGQASRNPRRHELLHALREAQSAPATDTAAWITAPVAVPQAMAVRIAGEGAERGDEAYVREALPELVGSSEPMCGLARLIRLVAPRSTTVLIEGETGTGKEVVAKALHRLSQRANKPFVVLNCAAIPETLLEAELFGHTRGAFTGAVQSRTGRIEAAHGGTLFLDEIGEMPLALQAKMLRFLECGELQRVGDNETVRVDVRVIAATHQPLEQRSEEGSFRLDLYHRLAVFPIEVPALRDRMEDLGLLAEYFLERMGREMPRKRLNAEALAKLCEHRWPGNVRELMHVLERGAILAEERMEIGAEEIRWRRVRS
ncbi:sigma-54 dependent transcriptional regulator [Edaphobacter bradus]|uniref:sigma-54 dependent transcriptional regulator n=1 Tax=Edaphobacter bradus TaxID=2259016 RepID=UPI0021E04711|nr:sigma-54 dependent transcriptional regulator [Edaphobacter bradus]